MSATGDETLADRTTREFCQRCHSVSAVGFHARPDLWRAVAGKEWADSILCLRCFAALGDEKHIRWEEGITFYPVSYASHHEGRRASWPSDDPGASSSRQGGPTTAEVWGHLSKSTRVDLAAHLVQEFGAETNLSELQHALSIRARLSQMVGA